MAVDRLVVLAAEDGDVGGGRRRERVVLRALADYNELPARHVPESLDEDVDPLVRHEPADRDVVVVLVGAERVPLGVDGGRDDLSAAAVGAPDPTGHPPRVGDVEVHAVRRGHVVEPEVVEERASDEALGAPVVATLGEVLELLVPSVAGGAVLVAHVELVGASERPLRRQKARRHDEVVGRAVEALDR